MKINISLLCMLWLLGALLSGCDSKGNFRDLNEYIAKVEQDTATHKKQTATAVPELKAVRYQKDSSRTPFEDTIVSNSTASTSRNPINMYPLNLLRFLGTVTENNQVKAYIMTPDNKVYQVTIGDTIGDHEGRIVKITTTKLEVREQPMDDGKQGSQRIVTLQLKNEG